MNKKALSLAIYIAISYPSASLALGLGEIESVSNLNQPFKAKIDLLSVGNANIGNLKVKVASPSIFSRVGIDRPNFLNDLRFRSVMQGGKPVILISSSQPVKEPFINFLLQVSWPKGQLLKEYTVLLDPPVLMQPNTSIASNTVGVRPDPSQRSQAQVQQQNIANQQARQQHQRQRVIAQQQTRQRQQQQQRQQVQSDVWSGPDVEVEAASNQPRTYRIRRGDTLFKVAKKLGYRGVRNEQMMMAIYQANPTAFRKRNINNLKSGVSVRRPSIDEARRLTLRAARQSIRSQTADWRRGLSQKASAANNNQSQNNNQNQNNTSERVSGNTASGNSQARVEVLGSTSGNRSANNGNLAGQAKLDDLNRQMTLASESLTARTRENNELKSRVSELEALLKKKNRLITLKNEQLAELQVSLGKPPATLASADLDIVDTNKQGGDIEKMIAGQEGNDGTIVRTQTPASTITNNPDRNNEIFQETVPDDITPALNSQESAEEEGGILGFLSSPLAMGLGGGSLLALIAGFLLLRRRNSNGAYDDYSPIDFNDPSFAPGGGFDENPIQTNATSGDKDPFAGLGGSSSSVENNFDTDPMDEEIHKKPLKTAAASPSASTVVSHRTDDVDEGDDILQEADVYIVYGLHDQAEVELKKAIEKQPDNLEYRAKLLENYHASDNKEAFEEAATEFAQMNGPGKAVLWEKISGWGSKLLPASPLFANPAVAAVINEGRVPDTAIVKKESELVGKLGVVGAAAVAAGGTVITAGKAFSESAQDKLADAAVSTKDAADSAMSDLKDSIPSFDSDNVSLSESKRAEVLDFDDMDLDSLLSSDSKTDRVKVTSIDVPHVDTDFDDDNLDFVVQDIPAETKVTKTLTASASDDNEIEFDFSDFEADAASSNTPETKVSPDAFDGLDDFTGLGFDFDDDADSNVKDKSKLGATNLNLALDGSNSGVGKILPESSVYKMSETKDNILGEIDDDLSFLDLDTGAVAGLEAQVNAKLDLARAYMDMGDVEGSRSTLEEVMLEGTDTQKKEAKKLLYQVG